MNQQSAHKTMSTQKRYKCKCCKYQKEFRLLAVKYVNKELSAAELQSVCSYLKLPKEQWTAESKQIFPRPAVIWSLDERGVIKEWSQRPNSLQEVLTVVLDRVDLATKHTELLDKFPTVKEYLYRLQSNPNSPTTDTEKCPIQESEEAAIGPVLASPIKTPLQETQNDDKLQQESQLVTNHEEFGDRTLSTASSLSVASSGFHDRRFSSRTMSNFSSKSSFSGHPERHDSGISVTSNLSVSTNVSQSAHPTRLRPLEVKTSLEPTVEIFCTNCYHWINNISPRGSNVSLNSSNEQPLQPSEDSSSSPESSPSNSLERIERSSTSTAVFGSIAVKRKELLKNTKPGKNEWSSESRLLPDLKVPKGRPSLIMSLQPDLEATGFSLCLNLTPNLTGHRSVQVPPLEIMVSVYAADSKDSKSEKTRGLNITNKKHSTTEMSTRKATEIAVFPKLITVDQLKQIDHKYIIIDVNVLVTDSE